MTASSTAVGHTAMNAQKAHQGVQQWAECSQTRLQSASRCLLARVTAVNAQVANPLGTRKSIVQICERVHRGSAMAQYGHEDPIGDLFKPWWHAVICGRFFGAIHVARV
jgi:hypothetical protein